MAPPAAHPQRRLLIFAVSLALLLLGFVLPESFRPPKAPPRGFGAADGSLQKLELSMPMRSLMIVNAGRIRSIREGFLFRTDNDTVPASLTAAGHREQVEVRLKGDFVDHLEGDKWSWRVHVKDGGEILGLRRFSLQAPYTRGNHWEALYFEHLRMEDVLAPRYEFVDFSLAGLFEVGAMALEEHFSKELLAAQRRKEGVMLRFDETEFWLDRHRLKQAETLHSMETDFNWRLARVEPFRNSVIKKSESLKAQATLAIGMLRGIQEGARPGELLDVDRFGRLLAAAEYWGFWHGLRWHNIRFYLNPYTLRIEPIAFDATSFAEDRSELVANSKKLLLMLELLSDPEIYSSYRTHLARMMHPDYSAALVDALAPLEREMVAALKPEFPELEADIDVRVLDRLTVLRSAEIPSHEVMASRTPPKALPVPDAPELPYVAVTIAHIATGPDGDVLELATNLREDVTVTALRVGSGLGASDLGSRIALKLPITLAASRFDRAPEFVRIALPPGLVDAGEAIRGTSSVPTHPGRVYQFEANAYPRTITQSPLPERGSLQDLLARHPFLTWDGSSFSIAAGEWSVTGPLIIPRELSVTGRDAPILRPGLRVEAGARLRFARDAFGLSFGALTAEGTPEAPIEFTGIGDDSWKGLVVLAAPEASQLSHVRIANTSATTRGAWQLTAGVTFYESEVFLRETHFDGSVAEDALNIVRSSFSMDRVKIARTVSDAFDSDFSTGTITASTFQDIQGDGIDSSGSTITVEDARISGVRDKAISAGEASVLIVRNVQISDVGAGVVSKDLSRVEVDGIELLGVRHAAFMSYTKKPEYGVGTLVAKNAMLEAGARLGMAQRGSSLSVNGKRVEDSELDVEALYSEGFMRK